MRHKIFKFHSDAGHGWLAVKRSDLVALGIIEKITPFSYQRGKTVYLEEDQDAGLFVKEYEIGYGHKPKIVAARHVDRSPIRSFESFCF